MPNPHLNSGVSVAICCHNSSDVIGPTIKALSDQVVDERIDYEVILVDNNCTDDTVQKAENNFSNPKVEFRVVREPTLGLIHARRRAAFTATYDTISFLDDDNIIDENWVNNVFETFCHHDDVGVLGSHNEPLIDGMIPPWFSSFQHYFACGKQAEHSGYVTKTRKSVFGAGISFRTQILLDIFNSSLPLFMVGRKKNQTLSGEDEELCFRAILMGWQIWYEESLRLKHRIVPGRLSWHYLWKLQRSFSESTLVLDIYRNLIEMNDTGSIWSIIGKEITFWLRLLYPGVRKNKIESFLAHGDKSPIPFYHLTMITFCHLRGRLKAILCNLFTYTQIARSITNYFSHYPIPQGPPL